VLPTRATCSGDPSGHVSNAGDCELLQFAGAVSNVGDDLVPLPSRPGRRVDERPLEATPDVPAVRAPERLLNRDAGHERGPRRALDERCPAPPQDRSHNDYSTGSRWLLTRYGRVTSRQRSVCQLRDMFLTVSRPRAGARYVGVASTDHADVARPCDAERRSGRRVRRGGRAPVSGCRPSEAARLLEPLRGVVDRLVEELGDDVHQL
jgi:hypothetical protein